jgi:hypothetical protein
MRDKVEQPLDSSEVAERLAAELNHRGSEYALGGAIALAYWAQPRGTLDVDLTLFLSPQKPAEVVWLLGEIGCNVVASDAIASIREHGFCRAEYHSVRVDVFLPIIPFYEHAKARRRAVHLGAQQLFVWDAETLAVFKMMFFRPQDLVDISQILKVQAGTFDRSWVRERLVEIYGPNDTRIGKWDDLISEQDS